MMEKHSIGTRLFYITLGIGFAVMFFIALVRGQISAGHAHERFDKTLSYELASNEGSAADALWILDRQALRILVQGIIASPYISYAAISDNSGLLIDAGKMRESSVYTRSSSLEHMIASNPVHIGDLLLQGDLDALNRDSWSWLYEDLPLEIIGVAFVALLLYWYMRQNVFQRLKRDAHRMQTFQIRSMEEPFNSLNTGSHDEINALERSINSLVMRLRKSYEALSQAQDASEANKQKYQDLFEKSPIALWLFDVEAFFQHLQTLDFPKHRDAAKRFFNENPQEGVNCVNLIHPLKMNAAALTLFGAINPEDLTEASEPRYVQETFTTLIGSLVAISSGAKRDTFETVFSILDGSLKRMSVDWKLLDNEENQLLVSFTDITEQKKAEEQIKTSLTEKEVLIRELFHRTKNNMQSLIALISFESWRIDNEDFREILQGLESRVYSMALVHRMLYEYNDLSRLSLTAYIREFCTYITATEDTEQRGIQFDLQLEEIEVTLDIAMPVGLILTELISNALKHAFPGKKEGIVVIGLSHTDSDRIVLSIVDNGKGPPPDFNAESEGALGLQLVTSLTQSQLGGTVEFFSPIEGGFGCRVYAQPDIYEVRI